MAYRMSIPNKRTMAHSNVKCSIGKLYCTVSIIPSLQQLKNKYAGISAKELYCTARSDSYCRWTEDYTCMLKLTKVTTSRKRGDCHYWKEAMVVTFRKRLSKASIFSPLGHK